MISCSRSIVRIFGMIFVFSFWGLQLFAQSEGDHVCQPVTINTTFTSVLGTNDFYQSTYKLYGTDLKLALHNLIKGHTAVSYASLWTYFQNTDKKPNGKVWDMYSDVPGGTPPYEFSFVTKQCGTYSVEGDCYNREHSWPKSWFNDLNPPYTDMFHLYPTDGKVNGMRDNWPYGVVASPTWTSKNGSKLGPNTFPGYSGTAFEPIDAYKGDFARSEMYMSVRYYLEDSGWSSSAGTNKSELLSWYANLFYEWSMADTVSQKEIDRNNAIYTIQKNRNPFIDHPEFAAEIWKTSMPPAVVTVKEMNLGLILIDFSRYLDSASAVNVQNITFDHNVGNPTSIIWGVNNDISKILISVPQLATGTTFSIQIKNQKSINNVAMSDTTISFKTSGITGVENNPTPTAYLLRQNYPNPFNPVTQIVYQTPKQDFVTLKVYNILGKEVAELVNGFISAGEHSVSFDASSLSSGTYFYALTAGEYHEIKKMILIK